MDTFINLLIYFAAGVIQDLFFTLNVQYVATGKFVGAVLTSFMTVFINMLVLFNILTKLDEERGLLTIGVYALGIAIGTIVAMRWHQKRSGL